MLAKNSPAAPVVTNGLLDWISPRERGHFLAPASPAVTNRLLDRLSPKERERVLAGCERVELVFSQVLNEPGSAIKHVYFPTDSYISLMAFVGTKAGVEVSLAGHEGFYGLPAALGVRISPVRGIVLGAGSAWRMGYGAFRRELERLPSLRTALERYNYVVMSQIMSSAGCNRYHQVPQRLSRWLLMTADRAHTEAFPLTHEFLARMLGVRRAGVSEAAKELQSRGLIAYKRGDVRVLDRKGLERAACGCYRAGRKTYESVFS